MKKLSLILMAVLFLLAGCSSGTSTTKSLANINPNSAGTGTSKTSEGTEESKGYIFENKGIIIAMHAKVAPILESLGKSTGYFEAESCAFQGMEKTYTYGGFELHTYESDKVDYVASVILLDDSVSTKEGIFINSNLDDVLKAYGDKYTKKLSSYTYELDKSKLSFLIENDKVTSIEYTAVAE